jgi:hypothetical protein
MLGGVELLGGEGEIVVVAVVVVAVVVGGVVPPTGADNPEATAVEPRPFFTVTTNRRA